MNTKRDSLQEKKYAETYGNNLMSMLPLITMFLGILLCAFTGNRTPRSYWSAGVVSILVGFFIYKDKHEFGKTVIDSIGNRVLCTIVFALYFSGILSKIISTGGLVQGLIWLTSTIKMPSALIPLISFIISAIMSTATGTSLGTASAVGPIMLPLAGALGSNVGLTAGAIISGSVFGDNLAPISDTTIASALTQQTEVSRVVRSRFKYSIIGATISAFLYIVLGFLMTQQNIADNVIADPATAANLIFMIVPVFVVFLMLKTGNLTTSLLMGDLVGILLLFVTGKMDFNGFVGKEGLVANGINGMINVTVFVWFIFVVSGIVRQTGGLDRLIDWLGTKATTSRSAELICNLITTCTVICIVSSASNCALAGSLTRNLVAPYHIARDRSANMLDGLSTGTAGLLPYSSVALTLLNFAIETGVVSESFSVFDILKYNFHCMALVLIFWLVAYTGWGRTYETDEQLAIEGIYIDPELSVSIPKGAKISRYVYKNSAKSTTK